MDSKLKALKEIERGLLDELEALPIFLQLESLRKTISTFEGNGQLNSSSNTLKAEAAPATYNAANFTWKQRILFVITKLGSVGISEIIKEIQKLEPDVYTKAFLDKRVGVTVSQLKRAGKIGAKKVDKRFKYFIK